MKLDFTIDKEYDIKMILQFKEAGIREYKEITRESLEEQYRKELPNMIRKQKEYQVSWDEIGERFSNYIEKATGYDWFYPRYECVLSIAVRGASNWGHEPKIVRSYTDNPDEMRRITAHELILSHYFEIYRRNYNEESLKDGQVWALAEIAAFALTSLTTEAKTFWKDSEYYTNHNYPHIVKLQNDLKPIFLESMKRKDFNYYIKKGIELVKEYPDMNPSPSRSKIRK
jgi:hypothetical protein